MFLVQNLIDLINLEADELLDTDEDNIPYINAAIDYLSNVLCSINDPEMMAVIDINNNDLVPSNFSSLIPANAYPVYVVGDRFLVSIGDSVNNVKYSIHKPHIAAITDTVPFKDAYESVLVFIAAYLVKKKSYIPVEYTNSDKQFVADILTAIKAAKGVV
jgi:hypothetical protein